MLLALFLLYLRLPVPTLVHADPTQTSQPLYAVLGPEAPAILHVLVGSEHLIVLQPGDLATLSARHWPAALIVPEQWADERVLTLARPARAEVVTLLRQNSRSYI